MDLVIAEDRLTLGRFAAVKAAQVLIQALSSKPTARLVVATGSSQFEVLDALVAQPGIDWNRIEGFHLDEYIGLPTNHPASFCGYLRNRFVDRVPMKSFYYLDGSGDPKATCEQAGQALRTQPIDLALIGIGENAHLAFNDPPADFETTDSYRIVDLDDACRKQQVGEGWFDQLDQVPRRAISMTVQQILSSQQLVCCVPDRRKAQAVVDALEGPVTPSVPASILQTHPQISLYLDQASSSLLGPTMIRYATKIFA